MGLIFFFLLTMFHRNDVCRIPRLLEQAADPVHQLLRDLGRGVEADALNRQGQAALKAAKDRD